jgi:guanosine-3',5'-bis(diphosphate) 3'-pyrophosphohydrolase
MTTLLRTVQTGHPGVDIRPIERAYTVAARAHDGQWRMSGDPYITHPITVATIVAEIGMSSETVCAALLHDTVEDTDYSLARLREDSVRLSRASSRMSPDLTRSKAVLVDRRRP